MIEDVKVLIVDDSALMRNLISRMVNGTEGLTVADTAMNGRFALEKIPRCDPDVIVLDIEMPEMNGVEFLRERKKRGIKIPVIVLSSIAAKGAAVTMECLSLGASDFVQKPSGSISSDIHTVADQVTHLLLAYGGQYKRFGRKIAASAVTAPAGTHGAFTPTTASASTSAPGADSKPKIDYREALAKLAGLNDTVQKKEIVPTRPTGKIDAIALGISTGGPDALRHVFADISPSLQQPILVVQHMPAGFTKEFAESLDKICPLDVTEAVDGEEVKGSHIYIAQGNKHLEAVRQGGRIVLQLSDAPLVSGHRPSADVLFASVAMVYQNHALGVIMTGMGKDGAQQLGNIRREGGLTLGQDEKSAVVYGMPRVAFEMGSVMEQVSLDNMGRRISEVAKASHL
jgi:two-component system chemotaxis response regulator CheB